ncbi:MAG: sugar phosphate isomerase/epimerase [Methanobrevibacter sp.]|jgi:sugar phosphate isomerase/epimerase|nr:sugar phosphate isomerase/epimerase [Methanobrevibacter sp.]
MKIGFSSLALFMKPLNIMLEMAKTDGFQLLEISCEGSYLPRYLLRDEIRSHEINRMAKSMSIDLSLHSPAVDLNPASMNQGVREETAKQIIETLDLAKIFGAKRITVHPGIVHRKEKRIRDLALGFAVETLKVCNEHAEIIGVKLCLENMPCIGSYLGNTPDEYVNLIEDIGCLSIIDWGHANTYKNPYEFLNTPNISYFHLSDNGSIKDQHLSLGEGTSDFSNEFLKKVDYGIIELNNYENVLKSKKFIDRILK